MRFPVDILGMGCVAVDDLVYVADYPPADSKTQVLGGQAGVPVRQAVQAFSPGAVLMNTAHLASDLEHALAERLDMLPLNKQVGFFSDAYCIEWTYAKAVLVRKQLARVLAEKISQGQYDRELALSIARAILYETPQSPLGMAPRDR